MKNIFKKLHKLPTFHSALALATLIMFLPVAAMAYGPSRPVFDWNDPNQRTGSMTGPVFDSFINSPGYGDERNFVRIAEADPGDVNPIDNDYQEQATAQPGSEYWVRIYVHNNANQTLNCSAAHRDSSGNCTQLDPGSAGIATGTNVRLAYDPGSANGHDVKAYISANGVTQVWDESQLINNFGQFKVEYVPSSTQVLTAKQNNNLQPISNDNINSAGGLTIGQDFGGTVDASGNYPGCFEFVSRIYVKVLVKAPAAYVTKHAYQTGTQNLLDYTTVAPGTKITWKIRYFNYGNDTVNNLTVRDVLPPNVTFVPGTLKWYTDAQNGAVQDSTHEDIFFHHEGINFGNYLPLTDTEIANDVDDGLITYQTTINGNSSNCVMTNQVFVTATGQSENTSSSTVTVQGCQQPATPSTPPATTPAAAVKKPAALVNTGPGDLVELFTATTAGSGAAYHVFTARRKKY